MKKSVLLIASILLLTALSTYVHHPTERMIRAWFKNAYEYMFTGPARVTIDGKGFGVYTGGFKGIVLYGGLTTVARQVLRNQGKNPGGSGFYDITSLERLAHERVYKKKGGNSGLNRYNPEFIRWAMRYLIPDPDLKIDGITCREIYRKVFSRFFRLLTETRAWLRRKRGRYKQEITYYRNGFSRAGFDALDYLNTRYNGELFSSYRNTGGYCPFTPGMAVGFWLRRKMDGTEDIFGYALRTFMEFYDRDWYLKAMKR